MAPSDAASIRVNVAEGATPARASALAIRTHSTSFGERYLRLCLQAFGALSRPSARRADKLRHALEQAHLELLPETYLAFTWMNTVLATVGSALALGIVLLIASASGAFPSPATLAVSLILPVFAGSATFVAHIVYPDYQAGERRRAIDRDLPYAVNFIAAMASAGVVPTALLRNLARETTYGEVAREATWIVRDIDLLGVDLLSALQRGMARTPSRKFQEFLQGAKTWMTSGGELKVYFVQKADQYMDDNRRVQKEFLESLGLMAESYVTVVIAGPLFMLVMMSIMLLIGNSGPSTETFLFLLTFVMLPVAHTAFAWIVKNMAPEG